MFGQLVLCKDGWYVSADRQVVCQILVGHPYLHIDMFEGGGAVCHWGSVSLDLVHCMKELLKYVYKYRIVITMPKSGWKQVQN
jgi:hypothetical protein